MLNAGVDIVGTANNHCCDRGRTGIERTVSILDSLGMVHMGTYKNEESYRKQNPMIINTRGFRLALLNYTYGTNGIPVPGNNVVSLIEKERIQADMKAVHDSAVDAAIVTCTGELSTSANPTTTRRILPPTSLHRVPIIVIGSRTHVIQPMEWRRSDTLAKEQLVVWSLGNYVSNQRKRYTDGGTMVKITLHKQAGKTRVKDATYQLTWVYNPIAEGKRQYYIRRRRATSMILYHSTGNRRPTSNYSSTIREPYSMPIYRG